MAELTPNLQLVKPTINGEDTENTWGYDLNANFDILDEAVVQSRVSDGDKGDIIVSAQGELWNFDPAVVTPAGRGVIAVDAQAGLLEQNGATAFRKRGITVANQPPVGGVDGDLWLQYNLALPPEVNWNVTTFYFNTRTEALGSDIPGPIKVIHTGGFGIPGDQGHGIYTRLNAVPASLTSKAYFRSVDRYKADGGQDLITGGYWGLVSQGGEVWGAQFGVVAGGAAASNTAGINEAIAYLGGMGGGQLRLSAGVFDINDTINLFNETIVVGVGMGHQHDAAGSIPPATTIKATGTWAAGTPMVLFSTPNDPGAARRTGAGVRNLCLDGNAIAERGVQFTSVIRPIAEDIYVHDVKAYAFMLDNYPAGSIAEPADTQGAVMRHLRWRMVDTPAVQNAVGVLLAGTTGGNTSVNYDFIDWVGQNWNGSGVVVSNADNVVFNGVVVYRLGPSPAPGIAVWWDNNTFNRVTSAGVDGIKIYGTASGNTFNPVANWFNGLDTGNGTAYPTMDPGCYAYVTMDDGGYMNMVSSKAAFGQDKVQAGFLKNMFGLYSVLINNANSQHIKLVRLDVSGNILDSFSVGINFTTGYLDILNAAVNKGIKVGSHSIFAGGLSADNGAGVKPITEGAADSGGSGYRLLLVPN